MEKEEEEEKKKKTNKKSFRAGAYHPDNPLPLRKTEDGFAKYLGAETSPTDHHMIMDFEKFEKIRTEMTSPAIFALIKDTKIPIYVGYLAINYSDRYISRNGLLSFPNIMNTEFLNVFLFIICCLRLACKMCYEDSNIINFEINQYFVHDQTDIDLFGTEYKCPSSRQIRDMELHILKKLDWEMRPVTPFAYINHIAPKLCTIHGFSPKAIVPIIKLSSFKPFSLNYKPSVIAASAILAASYFLYRRQFPSFLLQISSQGFEEGTLRACTEDMIDMCCEYKIEIASAKSERIVKAETRESQFFEEVEAEKDNK